MTIDNINKVGTDADIEKSNDTNNVFAYAVGICRDDNYRRIQNTEIVQIFKRLDSAKIYGAQLSGKLYMPVSIYKYDINQNIHFDTNNKKILICKYRHNIKTNNTICEV